MSELKDERENGDYDIYTGFDRQDAAHAFEKAEQFVTEMERYLSTL